MFLAGKAAYAGIVFLLLTTWISGPIPKPVTAGPDVSEKPPEVGQQNDVSVDDVNKMQQTLQDKGHYRGKVDGRLGLRTRAGIRAYQKAENLPITGQLDAGTAGRLGVEAEGREETVREATQDKPSAGISWAEGSSRTVKTRRRSAKNKNGTASERAGNGEKTLHAENDKHQQ